ncbi:MAG: discoidin domain-containing protein [Lachnospiraceae bacterium]|nr:discoidin domain-containing protein [Lachnospiraceae bacterium]
MKKYIKQITAVTLSAAMVLSSVDGRFVSAADVSYAQMIGNSSYNVALNKTATAYPGCAEGSISNLTNGNHANGHCALSSGWGYSGEAYAVVDLGDYYDASTIDEIVITYKDAAENDTVVGRTYSIQYSIDGINYDTVVTSETVTADGLFNEIGGIERATKDDVSSFSGAVRYVKVYYPSVPTYGIQITEIAVLDTDSNLATVDMGTCDNPAAVTVTADQTDFRQVKLTVTAGDNQEGFVYYVYMDDSNTPCCTAQAGQEYTISNVPAGTHTFTVVSSYQGKTSSGLESDAVVVYDYESFLTDSQMNLAYQKNYTLDSGNSTEGNGSITDGQIGNSYVTSSKGKAGSWSTIDLGNIYEAGGIDKIVIWYRIATGGCWPENGGLQIQYSVDGIAYETVATLSQAMFNEQRQNQGAPFKIGVDIPEQITADEVRYVRIYYPNPVAYGAQVSEVAVYDLDNDAKLSEKEVNVYNAADVTVASTEDTFGQIRFTVVAGENQSEYRYLAFLDDESTPALTQVVAGTQYVIDGVDAGEHTIKIVSSYQGRSSEGIISQPVYVYDYESYLTNPHKNIALLKDYTLDCDEPSEGTGSITNGVIASGNNDYVTATKSDANAANHGDTSWYTVDLGNVYDASGIDEIIVWYRNTIDGCYPTNNNQSLQIQFSVDNDIFTTVSTVTNTEVLAAKAAQGKAPFKVIADLNNLSGDVRYIRFYYSETPVYGAQTTEVAVFDLDEDIQLSQNAIDVPEVTNLTAGPSGANAFEYSFTPAEGDGFTYNVLLINQRDEVVQEYKNVTAGQGTINHVAEGNYRIAVETVDALGELSELVYSDLFTVSDIEQLDSLTAVTNDGQWHQAGGYSYKITNQNAGGQIAVDADDENHIQTKFTFTANDNLKGVQLKKSYTGLIPGETYKMKISLYSNGNNGDIGMSGIGGTRTLVKNIFDLELTAVADTSGKADFVFDLGMLKSGALLDFSDPVFEDAQGNVTSSFMFSDAISVEGFQMKTNGINGDVAFRTVCKAPKTGSTITVDGHTYTVAGMGTIFTLDPNPTYDKNNNLITPRYTVLDPSMQTDPNEYNAYLGYYKYNNVNYTYGYVATQAGIISDYNPADKDNSYYVRTMTGIDSQLINKIMHVRAFVVTTDNKFIYGTEVKDISVGEVAAYIYDHSSAPNYHGHEYLYSILSDASFIGEDSPYYRPNKKEYGWNDSLYTPEEKETMEAPEQTTEVDDTIINEDPEF